jgi:hypothetical protein
MECAFVEKYLLENGIAGNDTPPEIREHIAACVGCRRCRDFVAALNSTAGELDIAPKEIVPALENRIFASQRRLEHAPRSFNIFSFLARPSFAVAAVVLALVVGAYFYLTDNSVGTVDNLSARFKIALFENIKPGDVLYTGDSTTVAIRLKNGGKLTIHHNSVVRFEDDKNIVLSRGEFTLAVGDKELTITTPDGIVLARNTEAKITALGGGPGDAPRPETRCVVFRGAMVIASLSSEMAISGGQSAVLTGYSRIPDIKQLSTSEIAEEMIAPAEPKLFAAVQSLCDCIYAVNPVPGKKNDHLRVLGNESNEKKFRVRVYWREKGFKELVGDAVNENPLQRSLQTRRMNV